MNTKTVAVGSVLTVTLSVAATMMWDSKNVAARDPAPARATTAPRAKAVSRDVTTPSASAAVATPLHRTRATADPTPPVAAATQTFTVRGRALWADGLPAAGVGLGLAPEPERECARTRGDGGFELVTSWLPARIVVTDRDKVTLCAGACEHADDKDALVVLAPAFRFSGRVVDAQQQPLASAYVRIALADDWASRLGISLAATQRQAWTARSAADGRFAFAAAPAVAGSTLRAVLDGYDSRTIAAPELARDDVEIVLARPCEPLTGTAAGAAASTLRGRVRTPDGLAGSGARVALGLTTTVADDKGFFVLDLSRAVTAEHLRAVKEGYQSAQLERPATTAGNSARAGWPEYVELRLGPPTLVITGVVVDHHDQPVANAHVWLDDGTAFCVLGQLPLSSEGLAAGAAIPPEALESLAHLPPQDGDSHDLFRLRRPEPNACWPFVTADADGRFELRGLSARDYTLRVLNDATLQLQSSGPHPAGARDVKVRLAAPDLFATLTARVTCRGRPMAGVDVGVRCTPFAVRARVFGGTVDLKFEQPGDNARTDADGRVTLHDVVKERCHLVLRGDSILPREVPIDASTDAAGLAIEVQARCQAQVKLRAPFDRADAIAAVDEQGERLSLLVLGASSTSAYPQLPLYDGHSQVFAVDARARRFLLLKDGHQTGSIAIDLQLDVVNLVEG